MSVMLSLFAQLITLVSEDVLGDLFRVIMKEVELNRKKTDLSKSVKDLRDILAKTATEDMTDDQKNALLIAAGRAVIGRVPDDK